MATKVTNAQIADALRILGLIDKSAQVDLKGAQSTTWATRLSSTHGVTREQFASAVALSQRLQERGGIPPGIMDRFLATKATGDSFAQFQEILTGTLSGRETYGDRGQGTNLLHAIKEYEDTNVRPAPARLDIGSKDIQTPGPGVKRLDPTAPVAPVPGPNQKVSAETPQTSTPAPATAAGRYDTNTGRLVGAKPPPRSPEEVRDYIAENYPDYAYLQDIPEVWEVVKTAAKGELSTDRMLGSLHQTDWWKKTESSARAWLGMKANDPAEAADQIRKKAVELQKAATAAGVTIPQDQLDAVAEDAIRYAWDPNEVKAGIGRFFQYDAKNLMGTALATQQELRQKSRDWLVPLDDATLQKWTTQVVNGEIDVNYVSGYLQQQAATLFPQLADPISRGIPPGQWMQPYVSVAAQTLGMNPDQIDLREAKWMRAVNQVGPDGKRTAMNLADWEDTLKTDETYGWDKTDQGREHGATMARKLAGIFAGNA